MCETALPIRKLSRSTRGFTLIEVVVTCALAVVIMAFAVPQLLTFLKGYRISGDARAIASQLALARMRASGDFDFARVNFDTTANTYRLERFDKASSAWNVIEQGATPLSPGVSFGFGTISQPANAYQTSIAQNPGCPSGGSHSSTNFCITFNNRGIPVDGVSQAPLGNNFIYIGDTEGRFYAVQVDLGGKTNIYRYTDGAWSSSAL